MNYKDIKTYDAMNAQIVEYLAMCESPLYLYAAKRIEELEEKVIELQTNLILGQNETVIR